MKLPRLNDLDRSAYATLVLSILAAAAWLSAWGLESHVDLRRRLAAARVTHDALSPLPYRASLPATAALSPGAWTTVVRVDGLRADDAARACALAPAGGAVRLLALSADVPACLASGAVRADVRSPVTAPAMEVEMGTARWIVLDDAGRVRFSRRAVPTRDELTRTAAVFDTRPLASRLGTASRGDAGETGDATAGSDGGRDAAGRGETGIGRGDTGRDGVGRRDAGRAARGSASVRGDGDAATREPGA